jgi:hypothetical protein
METAASQSSVVPPIEPTPIDPRLTAAQAQLQADLDATRQQVGEALRGDSLSDLQAARRRLADLRQAGERYRRAAAAAGQNASQIDDHLERAGFHAVLALDLDLRNRITRLSQGRRR